jgi:hypothetical protein
LSSPDVDALRSRHAERAIVVVQARENRRRFFGQ